MSLDDPPEANDFELSVFGGGYGECLCVHLSGDKWVVIDSCINPDSGEPAALDYLAALGVDVANDVGLVLVTHWDDDHIRGISEVARRCESARVAVSLALRRQDLTAFVLQRSGMASAAGSGVDEFRGILELCRSNGRMIWAKANAPLFPLPPGRNPMVVALSPSEDSLTRSLEFLIEGATGESISLTRRYKAPDGPNAASVAAYVRSFDHQILLGADLEVSNNRLSGWSAVLNDANPVDKSSIVKIPHHGSSNGHFDEMWSEMLVDEAIAIITPWTRGGGMLPTDADIERIRGLAGNVFLTSIPRLRKAKDDPRVTRLLKTLGGFELQRYVGWGHVRARRSEGASSWNVETFGDALQVGVAA